MKVKIKKINKKTATSTTINLNKDYALTGYIF